MKDQAYQQVSEFQKGDIVIFTNLISIHHKTEDKGIVTSVNGKLNVFVRFKGETSQCCLATQLQKIGSIADIF